jgi:hypothetical protein
MPHSPHGTAIGHAPGAETAGVQELHGQKVVPTANLKARAGWNASR